ncbi:MAG: hypothetical protein HY608_03320, partial [Planctomycetes bacterium]|nr:hypothetical protein [Planctomycetota bacterium]
MTDPREETRHDEAFSREVRDHLLSAGITPRPRPARRRILPAAVATAAVAGILVAASQFPPRRDTDGARREALRAERKQAIASGDWEALGSAARDLRQLGAQDEILSRETAACEAWRDHREARALKRWSDCQAALQRIGDALGPTHALWSRLLPETERVNREVANAALLSRAEAALASEGWEDAASALEGIAADSDYAPEAAQLRRRRAEGMKTQVLGRADALATRGAWEEAIAALDGVADWGDDGRAASRREGWRVEQDAEAVLDMAGRSYREDPARARTLLASIGEEQACHRGRVALEGEVGAWEATLDRVAEARETYARGSGSEAIGRIDSLLEQAGLRGEALAYILALRERIRRVRDGCDEALARMDRGSDLDGARGLLREVLDLEPDPANAYRRGAAEALMAMERDVDAALADALAGIERSLGSGDWREVRGRLDALPASGGEEHPLVASARKAVEERAQRRYEEGYVLKRVDPEGARERWTDALTLTRDPA